MSVGLPPCCATCDAYDADDGVCRLLADPTVESRRRLLTMPCDVQRLLALRFRAQGLDVARDAIVAWLDPAWDPDDITLSYGKAPRDARLWLGSWPYLYLGRTAVRRGLRDARRERAFDDAAGGRADAWADEPTEPTLQLRVTRALDEVRRIDVTGYAMLLDFLHDRFDARAWGATLGVGPAGVSDRKYLALYRYGVLFHDVLRGMDETEAAALVARRFTPGDPSEHEALARFGAGASDATARVAPPTMTEFRELVRVAANRSLEMLAAPDAFGADAMADLGATFRRVLRLDGRAGLR